MPMLTLKMPWYCEPRAGVATSGGSSSIKRGRKQSGSVKTSRSNASSSPSASRARCRRTSIRGHLATELESAHALGERPASDAMPPSHGYQKCAVAPTWATSSVSAPARILVDVGRGDSPPDPVEVHLGRLDRPDLPRVRDHQPLGDPVAEDRPHPLLVVPRREVAASARFDRLDEPDEAVVHELDRQAVQVRLEREARVEVVRARGR